MMHVVKRVQCQSRLFQIVATRGLPCRLAGSLHRGNQQGDQNPNDGNHDQ